MLWLPQGYQPSRGALDAGSAAFTPASLTGLIGWWKADTGVTGSPVTAVADQSSIGASHNLSNSGTVPLNATGFNGHPAFDFVAANDAALKNAAFAIGTGNKGSVFVVGQMKTDTANFGGVISYAKDGSSLDYNNDGSAAWLTRNGVSNAIETYRANGIPKIDTSISLATNYVLASIFDGTNVTHYVNGVAGSTAAANLNWVSGGSFVIGNRVVSPGGFTGAPWDGPIAEVIVTNADNTADVASVYAYAQSKYGI